MSTFWIDSFNLMVDLCLDDCTELDANLVEFKDGLFETSDGIQHLGKSCSCVPKPKDELLHEIYLLKKEREKLEEERCRLSFCSNDYDYHSKENKDAFYITSYETDLCEIEETIDKVDTAISHGKMLLDFLECIEKQKEEKERQLKEKQKKLRIKYAYTRLSFLKEELEELEQEIDEILKDD